MVNLFNGWNLKLDEKKKAGYKEKDKEGKRAEFDPRKTRIPSFDTIGDALSKAGYGQIFTTPKSSNIYVITRGTWGEKSKDKVVKSFPAGTPYTEIKGYADRTKTKHGGQKARKDDKGREEAGYATKGKKDKAKNFKPVD